MKRKITEYIPYIFTKADIIADFDSDIRYQNWLATHLRNRRILRVRYGLYVAADISGYPLPTKFEIASKIADDSFICYHSALEYYGIANQVFNTVDVGSKKRFRDFSFDGNAYIHKNVKHFKQVLFIETAGVRVSSLERTVVDCIDNIDASGGIDELLNALEQIRLLDENKLLETLAAYDSVFLYQKAGYIFENYKDKFKLSNAFFATCKSHMTNQVKYFLQDEYRNIGYNSAWKLMAPKNLKSRITGE